MYDVINSVNCVIDDIEISYVAANEFAFSLYERIEIGGVRFFAMNLLGQAIQNFYLVFSYGIKLTNDLTADKTSTTCHENSLHCTPSSPQGMRHALIIGANYDSCIGWNSLKL